MSSKFVLATAGAAVFSFAANAADLSTPVNAGGYKDGYVPAADWTGFYLGVNGGYAGAEWKGKSEYEGATTNYLKSALDIKPDGGFGGGQLGYNKQINAFVVGIEADIEGSDLSGKGLASTNNFGSINQYLKEESFSLDYFGTVRGRVGYSFGSFLPYVTGGFAWGHATGKSTVTHDGTTAGVYTLADHGSVSEDQTGWVAGAGVEALLSSHWTLKVEYQHIDLGSAGYNFRGTDYQGATPGVYKGDSFPSTLTVDTIRAGLNYKFGDVYSPLK